MQRVTGPFTLDILKIQSWCYLWGMRLNPFKSYSRIVIHSMTPLQLNSDLIFNRLKIIKNCLFLKLLSVIFDSKLTIAEYFCSVASSISKRVGLFSTCRNIYSTDDVRNSFYFFLLPHYEYCHSVWFSAPEYHLKLPDRAFG